MHKARLCKSTINPSHCKHGKESINTESNQALCDIIVALVEQILKSKVKDFDSNTSELESKIDSLVYRLYNLTQEEIRIVKEDSRG